jgi:hypothetical protein
MCGVLSDFFGELTDGLPLPNTRETGTHPSSYRRCPANSSKLGSAEEGLLEPRTINRDKPGLLSGSSGFKSLGLGFREPCFDGDLHSIFHRIFEGHLDSKQAVLVGRFGFVRFYRPT